MKTATGMCVGAITTDVGVVARCELYGAQAGPQIYVITCYLCSPFSSQMNVPTVSACRCAVVPQPTRAVHSAGYCLSHLRSSPKVVSLANRSVHTTWAHDVPPAPPTGINPTRGHHTLKPASSAIF